MEQPKGIDMKLFIRDRNVLLIRELQALTWDGDVEIEVEDILKDPAEGLVSPANSFGYMDGGIDRYYCDAIGWHLHKEMQEHIKEQTVFSELLVGNATSISTGNESFPLLICAPTMRMPGPIPVHNIFLATRAAIALALELELKTCAMPGMGTGTGRVQPNEAAFAMNSGYIAAKNWFALNK
jgi:O-acetyl-ADP-ribose deacetylase (regulator of RNase III)